MRINGTGSRLLRNVLLFAIVTLAGCDDKRAGSPQGTDSVSIIRPSADTTLAPHEHDTIDAPGGVWSVASIVGALRSKGLGPVRIEGEIRQPFMGPQGMRLVLPGAEVQVFIYADALARARDTDRIDSTKVAPVTTHVDWIMPPSIIVINNAALIVLTRDETLRKQIHAAVRLHD